MFEVHDNIGVLLWSILLITTGVLFVFIIVMIVIITMLLVIAASWSNIHNYITLNVLGMHLKMVRDLVRVIV